MRTDKCDGLCIVSLIAECVRRAQVDQQSQLPMSHREYYLRGRSDRLMLIYEKFLKDFLREMGADTATIDADVNDILEFEIQLANVSIYMYIYIPFSWF
jgi:hypothetical protein